MSHGLINSCPSIGAACMPSRSLVRVTLPSLSIQAAEKREEKKEDEKK